MKHTNPTAASRNMASPLGLRGVSEAREAKASELTKPWGAQPICSGCNRGATYSCICDPFFDEGEPDYEAERRVLESLRQIDWCRQGWAKAEQAALEKKL